MRKVVCSKCGCDRKHMIKAKFKFQAQDEFMLNFKWLCIPCLLTLVGLSEGFESYDYNKALECCEYKR